jgi:hypothetical protein
VHFQGEGPSEKRAPLVHYRHQHVTAERAQGPHAHSGFRKGEAVDPVAVGQGNGLEVHHLQKALSPGKPYGQVSQQPLGFLQDPIKAGEVGEGGK